MAKEKIKQGDKAGLEQFLAENEISESEIDRLIAFAEGAEQNEILEILKLKQEDLIKNITVQKEEAILKHSQPQLKDITNNKIDKFEDLRQKLSGKLYDEENEYSPFIQANTVKRVNLSHEKIEQLRDSHLKAEKYLEKHIDKLSEESIEEIDKLVDDAYSSSTIVAELRDAIDYLAKESNTEQKTIKLIHFLESFYQSAPISKFYPVEIHEQNFKAAVLYSSDTEQDDIEALGSLYHDYLEI